jgi:hypothetical protein
MPPEETITLPRRALVDLGNADRLHFLGWLTSQVVDPQGSLSEKEIEALWPYTRAPKWYRQQMRSLEVNGYVREVGRGLWQVVPAAPKPAAEDPAILVLEVLAELHGASLPPPLQERVAQILGKPVPAAPLAASQETLRPPLADLGEHVDPASFDPLLKDAGPPPAPPIEARAELPRSSRSSPPVRRSGDLGARIGGFDPPSPAEEGGEDGEA